MNASCQDKCMCLSESLRGSCLANCVVSKHKPALNDTKPQYKIQACHQSACK